MKHTIMTRWFTADTLIYPLSFIFYTSFFDSSTNWVCMDLATCISCSTRKTSRDGNGTQGISQVALLNKRKQSSRTLCSWRVVVYRFAKTQQLLEDTWVVWFHMFISAARLVRFDIPRYVCTWSLHVYVWPCHVYVWSRNVYVWPHSVYVLPRNVTFDPVMLPLSPSHLRLTP